MKFAYADPPYHGMGKKMYGDLHDEAAKWDSKTSHIELLNKLTQDYPDGWVISCNPKDLVWLLPHAPEGTRIGAWAKTFHQIRKVTTQYAWESVLFYKGNEELGRKPMVRDYLVSSIAMKKGLQGAKPDVFNEWVLQLLNAKQDDEVVDLFPGSGGLKIQCDKLGIKYTANKDTV